MPTVYDTELPQDLLVEVSRLVSSLDAEHLLDYALSNPKQFSGYRINRKSIGPLRSRFFQFVMASKIIDGRLLSLLAESSLNGRFISVLTIEALELCFDEMMVLFGRERFLIGLLLDKRDRVRSLARNIIGGETTPQTLSIEEALASFEDKLSPFLAELGKLSALCTPKPSVGASSAQGDSKELSAIRKELESCKRSLAEAERAKAALSRKADGLAAERDKLGNSFDKLKSENSSLRQERKSLEDNLAALQMAIKSYEERRDSDVCSRVQEELAKISQSWLTAPIFIEKTLRQQDASHKNLMSRAADVLERQYEIDRNSGNRRMLRERLHELRLMLASVQDARREAIRVHPDLASLTEELSREIASIETILGEGDGATSSLVKSIHAAINDSRTPDDLTTLSRTIQELSRLGGLSATDFEALCDAQRRRWSLFLADAEEASNAPRDVSLLIDALDGRRSLHILLDGHNILFCLKPLFTDHFDGTNPGAKARSSLAQMVERMIASAPSCHATIVFDGTDSNKITVTDRVAFIFSGGEKNERHKADKAILGQISYFEHDDPESERLLVTDDRDLAAEARELGAEVMGLSVFAGFLG